MDVKGLDTGIADSTITDTVFLAAGTGLPGVVDWVVMRPCFGFLFMLVLEKQKCGGLRQFFAVGSLSGLMGRTRASPTSWSSMGTGAT